MTAVQPSLSVLVAVCQSARFLRRLIASLAAQDVADAEFLFCDDASTDGSVEVLKDLLGIDIPADQLNAIVNGIKSKLDLKSLGLEKTGILAKILSFFGKK